VAIDDTRLHKTGPQIKRAFYRRDPLSPKFYVNPMFGLRFLQASLPVPLFRRAKVGACALPIASEEVSVVKRPRRKLPKRKGGKRKRTEPLSLLERDWKGYRAAQKLHNLSTRFVDLMHRLRSTFDACGAAKKILPPAVDGSFCNRTTFTAVVQGVELIARARKRRNVRFCAKYQVAQKAPVRDIRHSTSNPSPAQRCCSR
jgi:hypothetical protein